MGSFERKKNLNWSKEHNSGQALSFIIFSALEFSGHRRALPAQRTVPVAQEHQEIKDMTEGKFKPQDMLKNEWVNMMIPPPH